MVASLFIFDLDGTLVNSALLIELAVQETLIKNGLECLPDGYISSMVGRPPADFFSKYTDLSLIERLVSDFRSLLETEPFLSPKVYPGAFELLEEIKRRNLQLAIATTKPTGLATRVLNSVGLLPYFSHVQGSESLPPKPNPASLLQCMKKLHAKTGVMVGDTEDDVMAAKRAQIPSVVIAHGSRPQEILRNAEPTLMVNNLNQLLNELDFFSL